MRTKHLYTGALAAISFLAVGGVANASSHREAPAIAGDPQADNTDVWAWTDATASGPATTVYIVAAYNPLEEPSGGPNFHKFSDDVWYAIHIARGDGPLTDAVTYQIRFKTAPVPQTPLSGLPHAVGGGQEFFAQLSGNGKYGNFTQTYTVTKTVAGQAPVDIATGVAVAPPNIGPRTNFVVYGGGSAFTYNEAFADTFISTMANGQGQVWAGPRDDGFYVDLARVFDLAAWVPTAAPPATVGPARDGVAGFNCHAIALAIPAAQLTGNGQAPVAGVSGDAKANDAQTLGIWASASRRKVRILRNNGTETAFGPWTQVSRLGLPLINEAIIGIQDKDKYNRTKPVSDVANFAPYFLNPVVVKDAEAVGIYTALGVANTAAFETNRTDIVNAINLTDFPATSSHGIPVMPGTTGDVLRVDLGFQSGFPNGRAIPGGATPNTEQAPVTDVLLSLILTQFKFTPAQVSQGAVHNDTNYLAAFPWLAMPWEGYTNGHGATQ
jgi:hypothetical protein